MQKVKKAFKKAAASVLGLSLVISLTACGGGSSGDVVTKGPDAKNLQQQKELNIMFPAASFTESIQPIVKEFEEANNVKVNLELIGVENYFDKVLVELSTGSDAYDVVYTFGEKMNQYLKGDWLHPIDDLIADKELTDDAVLAFDDLMERPVNFARKEGRLYGIPVLATTTLLYYRTDLFEQAGLTGPPETWAEFEEYAKILHKDGVAGMAMRGSRAQSQSMWTYPMVMYAFGGDFVANYPSDMTPTLDSKEVAEASDYYANLLRNYSIKGATTAKYSDIIIAVQQGDVAMWIDGAPMVKQYVDPELSKSAGKIGYATIPEGPAGRIAPLDAHYLSINAKAQNKELAWKFIQWATSQEMFIRLSSEGWHVSGPRKSTYTDPKYLEINNYGDGIWASKYLETLEKYVKDPYRPVNAEWPEVSDKVSEALSSVLSGQESAEQAFSKANESVRKIYKDAGYLK